MGDMDGYDISVMELLDQFAWMTLDHLPNQNLQHLRVNSAANFHNLDLLPYYNGHNPLPLNAGANWHGGEIINYHQNPHNHPYGGGAAALNYDNPPYGGGAGALNDIPPYGGGAAALNYDIPSYGGGAGALNVNPPYGGGAGALNVNPPYGGGAGAINDIPPYGGGAGALNDIPPYVGGAGAINVNPPYGGGAGALNDNRLGGGLANYEAPALDEYVPNLRWTSLQEIMGNMVTVATDEYGCRFLQNKLDEGNPHDIEIIFLEIKNSICDLMVHQFGNYLCQKFFEVCTQQHITHLLLLLINNDARLVEICSDMYGTRAMQTLVSSLTTHEQICCMASVLRRIALSLTKSMNGHHFLLHALPYCSPQQKEQILNVVAENCVEVACDKSGCCVLQQCMSQAVGESRRRLITQIISNALQLSMHPFGNYVVQYIIGMKNCYLTAELVRQLSGDFVSLCMDKYGSNVVEKFMNETPDKNQVFPIIEEIIYSPNFLRVLQDPFGNYVAQTSLRTCTGPLFHAMIDMINRNSANLHSHPHGKRVLEKTTKLIMRSTYMM